MYVILKGIMIKRILLTTFVFVINYISGDINNIQDKITDTSTLTENSEDGNAPNLSNQESSDDTLPDQDLIEYPFSIGISPLTNYAILQKWLIDHDLLRYYTEKKWDNIKDLIKDIYSHVEKYGISYDSVVECVGSLCWEYAHESYNDFCKQCLVATNA